jgi:short-subunit dehydrogenase
MASWREKICLVTGGSAGLGRAIGHALAESGAKVILVARRKEPLEAFAAELRAAGRHATAISGDVAWQEDVDRIAASVASEFGRLDVLCNCAGRSTRGAVLETTPEDFQQLIDVNFLATVRMTRALAPQLIASGGHLVNIGSLASKVAPKYMGGYPASKFAVAAYTQQLRLELGPQGVHVMLACPGPIQRDEAGPRYAAGVSVGVGDVPNAAQAPGAGARVSAIPPERLAAAILKACERRQPELVVPAKARLLFAISQLSAGWGDWLLNKFMRG